MILPADLVSQFAKTTKDTERNKKETTVYGTIVTEEGTKFVKLDGSDQLTPYIATVEASSGERVAVMLKNHTATIIGNITSPSAKYETVETVQTNVTRVETLVGDSVKTGELDAALGRITNLETYNTIVNGKFTAYDADIAALKAEDVTINGLLTATNATINTLTAENVDIKNRITANEAAIKDLAVGDLTAVYATVENLNAATARITDLEATRLKASDIEGKYANIDFSNITEATIASFYAKSGLIKDVVVEDATISGKLTGVTISGDLIEANTLVANKLVIQGTDGLYYKLNTDGVKTTAQQTDYNSLNGSVIKAKSVTADKITVSDLVAFGATIGGFNITESSIYSGVKSTTDNTTRGTYLDYTGQFVVGDSSRYIKFIKDDDGMHRLYITADEIVLRSSTKSIGTILDEHESLLNEFDSMEVGGRNLFLNSGDLYKVSIAAAYTTRSFGADTEAPSNNYTVFTYDNDQNAGIYVQWNEYKDRLVDGQEYVFSVWMRSDTNTSTPTEYIEYLTNRKTIEWPALSTKWQRYSIVGTCNGSATMGAWYLNYKCDMTTGDNLYVSSPKIERGNTPTDWTPAPEDVSSDIAAAQSAADAALENVGALETRVLTAETTISQNSKSIDLCATKTEVTTLLGNYSTTADMNSAISLSANNITNSVSATYATKDAFNNLKIGGRNFLTNSNWVCQKTKDGFMVSTQSVKMSSEVDLQQFIGKTVTFSYYVSNMGDWNPNTNVATPLQDRFGMHGTVRWTNSNGDTTSTYPFADKLTTKGLSKQRVSMTTTLIPPTGYDTIAEIGVAVQAYVYPSETNDEVWELGLPKMELGDKSTDWTPAPEDMATVASVTALDERVIAAESSISQNADSIAANVSETTALGTRMSTVEQTASGLTARLTNVESDVDAAQSTADTAKTNAAAAAKTATDYMNLSSAGLVVGQNPSSPTAGNTLISTDGVVIRKGTTVLAAFKAASRTASGISSATLTSTDSTDSESDGITSVSGTVTSGETRANVYITTNGNPVYFPNGIETDKVLINNSSGIIANSNIVLNGSLVDKSGEGILTPLNSYGNTVIGYGRYQDGGGTHVYGTLVKAKTKSGFSVSVNGATALDTNNSAGNATFGWHLYEAGTGETNIYGQITSLFSKGDMRLNAAGNHIRCNGNLIPYTDNTFDLGSPSLTIRDIYISGTRDSTAHGIRFANSAGSFNVFGLNADGYYIFGNSDVCTNIVAKSTTTSNTGYSFKITCGENPALTVNDNDARLLLYGGTDSTSRYLGSMAVYKRTYSNAANVHITSSGMMGRSTSSSQRYKKDIIDLDLDTVKNLYDLPVRQFKYRTEHISADDERYERDMPGFIAEEVAEYLPIACDHIPDADGNLIPEMWNSKIIVPALLKLIQDLNGRLKSLEERSI